MLQRIIDSFLVLIGFKRAIMTNKYIAKRGKDIVVSIDGPDLETALIAVWVLSQNSHYWTFTDLGKQVLETTLKEVDYGSYRDTKDRAEEE